MSLVLGLSAFGKVEDRPVVKLGKYQRIITDESRMNREGQRFLINASPLGVNFLTVSSALEFGYYLSTDEILSLQYISMRDRNTYRNEARDGFALEIGYKKFTSNSFYIKPELYYRTQLKEDSYDDQDGIYTFKDFTDIGVIFKIGNQWQWESFTLGCDWIGVGRSLIVIDDVSGDDFDKRVSISYLNLNLGMSF